MSDVGIGIGLQFDTKTLDQLNQISKYIENIQKKIVTNNNNFNRTSEIIKNTKKVTNEWQQAVEKISETSGTLINKTRQITNNGVKVVETYKNQQGTLTKIASQMDNNLNVIKHSVTESNKLVQNNSKMKGLLDGIVHSIGNAVSKMLLWVSAGTLLFGTLRGIQNAFKTMSEMEMAGVNIGKVLPNQDNLPLKQLISPFEESSITLAKQYGQSVLDVEKAMASWARRYKEVHELSIMTRASLLAATATDIGFEESVTSLSAIMSEWNFETTQSIHLVNLLNENSNSFKVTAMDLADALARTGSGAKAVGLNIEQLTGVLVTGIQSLGIAGNEVGTMWTRVMARFRGNKSAREAIEGLGIDAFAPLNEIMDELMIKWDFMTNAQKESFAITVAGTQHWSRFTAIMDNFNTVIESTAKSYFSANSAQKEVNNVMATLQKHIGQLNASWQEYIYKNSALLGVQKGIVDTLRMIVAGLNSINPAITASILVIGGLTAAIFAVRNAYEAWKVAQIAAAGATAVANTTFKAFTVTLLTNPFTAIIAALSVVTGLLLAFGSAAVKAEDALMQVQIEQEKLNQSIEDKQNIVRGLDDMAKKYEKLQDAISKTTPGTQTHISLTEKLTTVQNEMAKALGMTTEEFAIQLNKDGSISNFAKRRAEELVKQINLQRQLQWEMQQMMVLQGKPKDLSFLMNFEQVKAAMEAVNKWRNNPGQYLQKSEFNKLAGTNPLTQSTTQKVLDLVSNGMTTADAYGFKNNKYIKELESLFEYISVFNKNKPKELTLEDVLSRNTSGGSGGGTGDPDETKQTINSIFTNLTQEAIKAIKDIGQEWEKNLGEPFKKDINKYIFPNGSKMEFEMSSEIRGQLDDIFKPLGEIPEGIRKAVYNYNLKIEELSKDGNLTFSELDEAQSGVRDTYKKYIGQIDETKFKLQELQRGLDPTTQMFKLLTDVINALDTDKINLMTDMLKFMTDPPKYNDKNENLDDIVKKPIVERLPFYFNEEDILRPKTTVPIDQQKTPFKDKFNDDQQKFIARSLNELSNILADLGAHAAIASTFFNNVSKNLELLFSSDPMDQQRGWKETLKGFGIDLLFQMIGGLISLLAPVQHTAGNYQRDKQQNYVTYEQMKNYKNFRGLQTKLTNAEDELHYWDSMAKIQLGLNGNVNKTRDQWKEIVADLQKALESAEQIRSAFGVSVDDMAGAIENAFQATNYMDFLSSWSKNLEDMTRSALIKAFMSSSKMNTFYQTLSDKVWNAITDQKVTSEELADIKSYSHNMDSTIKTFYDTLNQLGLNNSESGGQSGGGSQDYVHGTSQPIVYNNYISIHAGAFVGDRTDADTFLLWIKDGLEDIESRA
jgi:TP901 family phage tail tape measure protein